MKIITDGFETRRDRAAPHVLVVDSNSLGRFAICETLREKLPHALVSAPQTAPAAFMAARTQRIDAVVCHRIGRLGPPQLIRAMRAVHHNVPIVSTSEPAQVRPNVDAGATRFVRYGAWYTVAAAVEDVIGNPLDGAMVSGIAQLMRAAHPDLAVVDLSSGDHCDEGREVDDMQSSGDVVYFLELS